MRICILLQLRPFRLIPHWNQSRLLGSLRIGITFFQAHLALDGSASIRIPRMRPSVIAIVAVGIMLAETPTHGDCDPACKSAAGTAWAFRCRADGSDEHPLLTPPDTDYDAVWAPDGRSIVFTSERTGSADLFRV